MTGESIDYEDILSRWKRTKTQAANDLERYLLRGELPDLGSVARAIVTLREGWISCKDRLPDTTGIPVLTMDKWGHISDRTLRSYSSGVMLFSPDGLAPVKDILRWMPVPLPEPPKEAKENV